MTNKPAFFFDTADVKYIETAWEQMKGTFTGKEVVGITTNPNALEKVACRDMTSLSFLLTELCDVVSRVRDDDQGVVYVQLPNSQMKKKDILRFAKQVSEMSDGQTVIGLKIPPFVEVLELVDEINEHLEVNVTGLADCSTALKCLTYNVRYVSVIPGRMEEKGIDAKRQIDFINQRRPTEAEIITGSMRTLEGLRWVIEYGTVPTIGSRVFDQILKDGTGGVKSFIAMWSSMKTESHGDKFSPLVTQDMIDLSVSFFEQMDEYGKYILADFLEK